MYIAAEISGATQFFAQFFEVSLHPRDHPLLWFDMFERISSLRFHINRLARMVWSHVEVGETSDPISSGNNGVHVPPVLEDTTLGVGGGADFSKYLMFKTLKLNNWRSLSGERLGMSSEFVLFWLLFFLPALLELNFCAWCAHWIHISWSILYRVMPGFYFMFHDSLLSITSGDA